MILSTIAVTGASRVSSTQYAVLRHDNTQILSGYHQTMLTCSGLGALVGDTLYSSGGFGTYKENLRSNTIYLCMPLFFPLLMPISS